VVGRKGRQAKVAQEEAIEPRFAGTRRGLLAGAAGALGLLAGETVLAATPAQAGTDGDVVLGEQNSSSSTTIIRATGPARWALSVYAATYSGGALTATGDTQGNGDATIGSQSYGPGAAVYAANTFNQPGVKGPALTGYSDRAEGLYAQSGVNAGTSPGNTRNGVHGVTDSPSDSGVWGEAVGAGYGVSGSTNSPGISGPAGVWGANSGTGPGVKGTSNAGAAVFGQSGSEGLYAQSGGTTGTSPGATRSGVHGVTNNAAAPAVWGEAVGGGDGVSGTTTSTGNVATAGVVGQNHGTGPGVSGSSNGGPAVLGVTASGGVGVLAQNTSASGGAALQVIGTALFSRAGHGLISGTSTSATVFPPGGLTGTSTVLAILQTALPGVWVTSAVPNPSNGSATISLSQAPGSGKTAVFAWFVVN
jgi:hypothetical protein